MSMTVGSSDVGLINLREGLRKLKNAAAINIISTLLVGIGAGMLIFSGYVGSLMHPKAAPALVMGSIILVAAVALVGAILTLISLFAFLVPAFSRLRDYKEDRFGTPSKLIKVGYVGGFLLLVIGMLVMIGIIYSAARAGAAGAAIGGVVGILAILVISVILLFIGQIGVIIGMFRLNDELKTSSFLAAGILFIIGIFINILNFIGWILVFIGSRSALRKVESGELGVKEEVSKPSL